MLKDGPHRPRRRSKATYQDWSGEKETPQTAPVLTMSRVSDQSDGVDGMGSVALRDGADEEEYFGIFLLLE
jgi:hypothetical protein